MRLLVAPQELKGTLTAREAALAVAVGIGRAHPDWRCEVTPLADGGPGTLEALLTARGGRRVEVDVEDPLGRPVRAAYGMLDDGTAVVEAAQASGLMRVGAGELDPLRASTFGTGELIAAALEAGAQRLLVGVGGSATNDGGAGALEALGVRLLDEGGQPLPRGGAALARLARIDRSGMHPGLAAAPARIRVATDVQNPLLGPLGATRVYAPQKGADAKALEELEKALTRFAEVVRETVGVDCSGVAGTGAAGGLAFGLRALGGAELVSGFDEIASSLRLEERIRGCDAVLTGEGRLDAQTSFGKGPSRLAQRARALGRRVITFVGAVAPGADTSAYDEVVVLSDPGAKVPPKEVARAQLEAAAQAWAAH